MTITDQQRKRLRKCLAPSSKSIDLPSFLEFMTTKHAESKQHDKSPGLAKLPPEVPTLPKSFKRREHAHAQLLDALISKVGARSTAVTAPKSRISSQGMGGVGKTMLTAAGTVYPSVCTSH